MRRRGSVPMAENMSAYLATRSLDLAEERAWRERHSYFDITGNIDYVKRDAHSLHTYKRRPSLNLDVIVKASEAGLRDRTSDDRCDAVGGNRLDACGASAPIDCITNLRRRRVARRGFRAPHDDITME